MGWLIFDVIAWLTALKLVPSGQWKRLWPIGIIGMLANYAIDSTLVGLGAFDFNFKMGNISGLPAPYWLSYFPGGILFGYYCPEEKRLRFLYVLVAALVLLAAELIMIWFGYFYHINWNIIKSYLLNVFGFTALLWLSQWIGAIKNM